jgi:DNA-binding NtrC family response regulator
MSWILVVDDDSICRDSMRKILERGGYNVEVATDVDSALDALKGNNFDLMVCDFRMPGKSGLDLLSELKVRNSRMPVVMVSAFADSETEKKSVKLGARLLRKPFRRQELLDETSRCIHHI